MTETAERELGRLYADAAKRLESAAVKNLVTANNPRRLRVEVDAIIAELNADVAAWIAENAPEAYAQGVRDTNRHLRELGLIAAAALAMGRTHRTALQIVVNNMQDVLETASADMAKNIRRVARAAQMRSVIEREVRRTLAGGATTAEAAAVAKRRLIAEFGEKPFRIGGRGYTAEAYSQMIARTMAQEAETMATLNRAIETGNDLVQVSAHGADDACGLYENGVFSISGTSETYPPLSSTPNGGPPFHPNCRHTLAPYVESAAGAQRAEDVPPSALGKTFAQVQKQVA